MKTSPASIFVGIGAGLLVGAACALAVLWLVLLWSDQTPDSLGKGMAVGMMAIMGLGIGFAAGSALGIPLMIWIASRRGFLVPTGVLAAAGYGVALWAWVQYQQLHSDANAAVQQARVQQAIEKDRLERESRPPTVLATPGQGLDQDPNWRPTSEFPQALKVYGDLLYPGGRCSREPDEAHNSLLTVATADDLGKVTQFYRGRTEVKVDAGGKFVGTAETPGGRTVFVGVSRQGEYTYVSLSGG